MEEALDMVIVSLTNGDSWLGLEHIITGTLHFRCSILCFLSRLLLGFTWLLWNQKY